MLERVRVGDVLALQRRGVTIDPVADYTLIGVYSFGKGIFHREPSIGAELGNYRFFKVEPGDLVLSNIQAWEGAIGYATEADIGTVGTNRFLSYRPISDRIDANWARWFFLSEPGMALIRQAAPGTTMRNRTLAVNRFETLTIPLPPLDEQRQVAARLDTARRRVWATLDMQRAMRQLDKAVVDSSISRIVQRGIESGWQARPLGEVAAINPGRDRLESERDVSFVPMAALNEFTGCVESPQIRRAGSVGAGYKQFRRGDIIFARITPCMQNGKTAIFEGGTTHGYGSTEFHVLRPGSEVRVEWLHRLLRTQEFRSRAARCMTGTAGQQRVQADFMRTVDIPVPSLRDQDKTITAIDRLFHIASELRLRRRKAFALMSAIEPSIMNQVFDGFI